MWPKVLMQLFELLPHATRLIPIADRYFSQRTANEKATEAVLTAIAEDVRGDLGQVTRANEGLYRHLQEQTNLIAQLGEDVRRAHTSIEQHDHRLEALNQKVASLALWVKGGVSVIVVLLAITIWLIARSH
jgi:ABC-type transporter Mla subunit MlaD